MDSRSLVPGDLLVVKDSWLLPCDLLILEGAATPVLLPLTVCFEIPYNYLLPADFGAKYAWSAQ